MPYDAFTLNAVINELNANLLGGKINKILQHKKDEIMLLIYKGKTYKLLLSAAAVNARIHITSEEKQNPETPFAFCMALRKYLSGGIIREISQLPYDRIITIIIENTSEMFDNIRYRLVLEIMGRQSNIILCDQNEKILALQKKTPLDVSPRAMLTGMTYSFPLAEKIKIDDNRALSRLFSCGNGYINAEFLCRNIMGLSKETASHILCRAEMNSSADTITAKDIIKALEEFDKAVNEHICNPCVLKQKGILYDFFLFPYCNIKGDYDFFTSVNECVDYFYTESEKQKNIENKKRNLTAVVKSFIKKTEKKIALLCSQINESEKAEFFRKCGELITANIYKIKKSQKSISVADYYNNGEELTINLDENLSPSANAQKYYKKYNKLKKAKQQSEVFLKSAEEQLEYLLSLVNYIEKAGSLKELEEISEELSENEILKIQKKNNLRKQKNTLPDVFKTQIDGFTIYCGKNNLQNDYITFRLAKPSDIWFHIKNAHGPHVVLKTEGRKVNAKTFEAAALLAAEHVNAGSIAVDYTLKKYVKKPNGAKIGFVVYTDYKTIIVKK